MVKILTAGTFDCLHPGHIRLLKRAKELGTELFVMLSTDEFNKIKGKESLLNYEQRKEVLKAVKYVNVVIPEKSWEDKQWYITAFGIDKFVMGDDWKGKFDDLSCEVIYLPRTEGISTTQLKEKMK